MNQDLKLKLLLVSTDIYQTSGYSKVTYGLLKELGKYEWLQVVHYAIQGDPALNPDRSYPSNVSPYVFDKTIEKGFGFGQLAGAVQKEAPHIVMIYNDLGVVTKYLEGLKDYKGKVWAYLDQIYENGSSLLVLNKVDRVFCFTKEWKDQLKKQGITRPIDVLPHGFDKDMFPVISRAVARQQLKIPEEVFLFLNLNRNQPRKHYDLLIMAFVDLISRVPEKPLFLMCVCDNGETGGYNLFDIFSNELAKRSLNPEQFGNRLIQSNRYLDFTDAEVGVLYQAADVGITCTDGEGFGLCSFESMGLGVPQILTNVVGHRTFCDASNSILVEPALTMYVPTTVSQLGGEARIVDPMIVSKAMETYVNDASLRQSHGFAAMKTVEGFTWPNVSWALVKRLELLHAELVLDGL
uniref:Glycosyl transferase family 1 domain-containing protein n=1 Tax=viral metagenome TaxID=1070528 RepID=A0A6C0AQP6_9ZZZZ